jgi:phosphate transport system protein
MRRQVDEEMQLLLDKIVSMGARVEQSLDEATQALILRENSRFEKVFQIEKEINKDHLRVDEMSLNILATQSPLAADLRLVLAIIKINNDLERMGDQAVNISKNGQRYIQDHPLKPLVDLPQMAGQVQRMVRESLDALVRKDMELAKRVLERDDVVDSYKKKIFDELIGMMKANPAIIDQAICLILIARNLERLGDHATNIAEDVVFAYSGQDIRHGHHGGTSQHSP